MKYILCRIKGLWFKSVLFNRTEQKTENNEILFVVYVSKKNVPSKIDYSRGGLSIRRRLFCVISIRSNECHSSVVQNKYQKSTSKQYLDQFTEKGYYSRERLLFEQSHVNIICEEVCGRL